MPLAESATRDERQPLESFLNHFFLLFFLEWPSRAGCVRLLAFYNLSFSGYGALGMSVRIRMIMDHESNDACTGRMKRVWVTGAYAPVRSWAPPLGDFFLQILF